MYKVTLHFTGASMFRATPIQEIIEFCDNDDNSSYRIYSTMYKAFHNRDIIKEIALFLENVDPSTFSKRIESNSLDIYTNDENFYLNFATKFDKVVTHRFEPDTNNIDKLSNEVILTKRYPHNRYKYRVYLFPHKLKGDKEQKTKYINWIKSQNGKITCSPAVENWFMTTDWNWDRRYVLVEDESTLLMLKLRDSNVMGKVYNYILSDK